jgi:glycosyltransferase involved in cell wall biosynthesis
MKILFVSNFYPPGSLGGVQLYTHGIAKQQQDLGLAVQVLCVGEWSSGARYYNGSTDDVHDGVPVHRMHLNWSKAPQPFRYLYDNPVVAQEVKAFIGAVRPSIVHITSCEPLSGSVLHVARQAGIPVVMTLAGFWFICPRITLQHADGHICNAGVPAWECVKCLGWGAKVYCWPRRFLPDGVLKRMLTWVGRHPQLTRLRGLRGMIGDMDERRRYLRKTLEQADVILSPSQYVRDAFDVQGMPAARIQVLEWGIPAGVPILRTRGSDERAVRFAFFGRISPIKGADVLLRAFRSLRGHVELTIHGDPDSHALAYNLSLRQMAAGDPRILFKGSYQRADMPALLAQTDVVVVPSLVPETFCLVPREALVAGVPVIASQIGAIPDAVQHEQNGLLVAPGDVNSLASAMQRLVNDRALRHKLSSNTRPVKSIQQECDQLIEIYRSCIARTR